MTRTPRPKDFAFDLYIAIHDERWQDANELHQQLAEMIAAGLEESK